MKQRRRGKGTLTMVASLCGLVVEKEEKKKS